MYVLSALYPFISYAYDPYLGTIWVFTEELSAFPRWILRMSIVFYKTEIERLRDTLRVTKSERDFRRVTISTLTLLISIFTLTLLISQSLLKLLLNLLSMLYLLPTLGDALSSQSKPLNSREYITRFLCAKQTSQQR